MVVELNISSFKILKNKTWSLPDFGLVLLNGKSGLGKSTLLNSIMFCLHNYNGRFVGEDASVSIKFPNLTIQRSKKPNRLQIKNTHNLLDAEAQEYLNTYFHTEYIIQSGYDWFLVSSQTERKIYLEKLAGFSNETTCDIENCLIKNLKQNEIEVLQSNSKLSLLKEQLAKYPEGQSIDDVQTTLLKKQIEDDIVNLLVDLEKIKKQEESDKMQQLNIKAQQLLPLFKDLTKHKHDLELMINRNVYDNIQKTIGEIKCVKSEHDWIEENIRYTQHISKKQKCEQIVQKFQHLTSPSFTCRWCNKCCDCSQNQKSMMINSNGKRTWDEEEQFMRSKRYLKEDNTISFDKELYRQDLNKIDELKKLKSKLPSLEKLWPQSIQQSQIDSLKQQILNEERCEKEYKTLLLQMDLVQNDIHSTSNLTTRSELEMQLKGKQAQKNHYEFLLEQSRKYKIRQEFLQELENFENENRNLMIEKNLLKKLNKLWKETKNEAYFSLLKNIENGVNNILHKLFNDNINVTLLANDKQEIEIQIFYKTKKMSLGDLSGGEKSRLSIAFTCTLMSIRSGKMLLLDEACSGLDYENFVQVLEFLRECAHSQKILIIFVSHQTNIENFVDFTFTI